MPTCFFILSRFILRVDNVLFRIFDTRIYHSFSSTPSLLVREIGGWEAPYERVQRVRPFYQFFKFLAILQKPPPASPSRRRLDSPYRSRFRCKGAIRTAKICFSEGRSTNRLERPWKQDSNCTAVLNLNTLYTY